MPDYIDLDVGSLDAEDVRQDGRDYMQAQAPAGWVINPWLDWLLGAVARMQVMVLTLASLVPQGIFKAFGVKVLRIPSLDPTAATGIVTIHASTGTGGTLAAGAQIDIDGVAFLTTADSPAIAAAGTGTTPVQAVLTGAARSGLTGTAVTLVAPSLTWVDSVSLNSPTIGGVDGETDDAYVDRLADEIPTLSPKAILIDDVSVIARADAEVFRALAIDNLVPPSTTGVAGAVTVAVMDASGGTVSGDGKTRVEAAIETGRILGINAYVIDPTVTQLDVAFTAQCYATADPTAVAADAKAAIKAFLSPLTWGIPPGGTAGDWVDEPTVIHNDLFRVLYAVPGIRHVTAVTLGTHGGSLSASNVALTGPAGVPTINLADIAATVAP